jgi:peptidoglycan/LPS O-acetylase OafA/YrhL
LNATPSPAPGPLRYRALDGYRFVAALLVAVHHYNMAFGLGLERWFAAVPELGAMVDFFFILSGFVIGVSYAGRMADWRGIRDFLQARLARLYPLHLATALAALSLVPAAYVFHLTPNHPEATDLAGLPANLALMHAWGFLDHLSFNGPSWSISAEWFAYLLCPLLFLAAARLSLVANIAGLIAWIVAFAVWRNWAGATPWWDASYDGGAFRAAPVFFAGVLIAFNLDRVPARLVPSWLVVHALFLAALFGLNIAAPREIVILLFVALIATAALAQRGGPSSVMGGRVMSHLGDASYAVYLLHFLIAIPVLLSCRKLGLIGTAMAWPAALATLAFSVGVSLLVYRWFELPLRRYFGPGPRKPSIALPRVVQSPGV